MVSLWSRAHGSAWNQSSVHDQGSAWDRAHPTEFSLGFSLGSEPSPGSGLSLGFEFCPRSRLSPESGLNAGYRLSLKAHSVSLLRCRSQVAPVQPAVRVSGPTAESGAGEDLAEPPALPHPQPHTPAARTAAWAAPPQTVPLGPFFACHLQ